MKKIFRTNFEEDFLKVVKKTAVEYNTSVNDIFEACFKMAAKENRIEEALEIIKKEKR